VADCPKCGKTNDAERKVCEACGAPLSGNDPPKRTTLMPPMGAPVPPAIAPVVRKIFCPQCGAPIPPGLAFCGKCGGKLGE
jgi:predicted nucleic acid-binding Zn ribbon protein